MVWMHCCSCFRHGFTLFTYQPKDIYYIGYVPFQVGLHLELYDDFISACILLLNLAVLIKSYFIQLRSEVYIHLGWSHYNLFFNHSTNFLLTNYSFGKSVRTSNFVHDTCASHFSNNCLQIISLTSLYHNSSGSEVYMH